MTNYEKYIKIDGKATYFLRKENTDRLDYLQKKLYNKNTGEIIRAIGSLIKTGELNERNQEFLDNYPSYEVYERPAKEAIVKLRDMWTPDMANYFLPLIDFLGDQKEGRGFMEALKGTDPILDGVTLAQDLIALIEEERRQGITVGDENNVVIGNNSPTLKHIMAVGEKAYKAKVEKYQPNNKGKDYNQ